MFLHQNDEFKDLIGTQTSYTAAKEYYVWAKLEFPHEIAQIMNDLQPVAESHCPEPE